VEVTRTQREDGAVQLGVEGELDLSTAPILREALLGEIGDAGVWVDLGKCSFMDSTGLRVIIEAARRVAERNLQLGIIGLREQPKQLFEITSLDQSGLLRFELTDPAP
jgi:anti-sigma B factor antagonist